ncbi:MAG: sigma 54-interacting transcriptional regulator, partial [Verrucomicrobiota bacterium]|nr:sigma 54-interacting transcriptional regulator [Verrucomicrobiota bacterium]
GTFERVGSEKTTKTDVRIISATNKDIATEISNGNFREDLYYRLAVVPLQLPPLRNRGNDILMIAEHLLENAKNDSKRENLDFSPEVLKIMLSYDWPGNIRELQNWIQYAMLKCKGDAIEPIHLPNFSKNAININIVAKSKLKIKRKHKLDSATVEKALTEANGNKVKTAKLLGVGRATLYRFLNQNKMSQ